MEIRRYIFLVFALVVGIPTCIAQEQKVTGPKKKQDTTTTHKTQPQTAQRPVVQAISTSQKVDLGLSVYWCGYNVGAHNPEEFGNYYAWAENTTKSVYTQESYKVNTDMTDIRGYDVLDAAREHMGDRWRLPTKEEYEELEKRCKWTYTQYKGINGYKVVGPNGKAIFFPFAGIKDDAIVNWQNMQGAYWCSNVFEDDRRYAWVINLTKGNYNLEFTHRYEGRSIRAVCTK